MPEVREISKWCEASSEHEPHHWFDSALSESVLKCPGYDRDQSNGQAPACCNACAETHQMVTEIHAGFKNLALAMSGLAKNPMMTAMTRQFGFDPAVLANLGKTGE